MDCYEITCNRHNGDSGELVKVTPGLKTIESKDDGRIIPLGLPDINGNYHFFLRIFSPNPPRLVDDRILEAAPTLIPYRDKNNVGKIYKVPALSDYFWRNAKVIVRVHTSTNNIKSLIDRTKSDFKDNKSPFCVIGRWSKLIGSPNIYMRGTNQAFCNKHRWSDDLLIMNHGEALLIKPQGSTKLDHYVAYNKSGKLSCIRYCDFTPDLFKEESSDEEWDNAIKDSEVNHSKKDKEDSTLELA